ncbi:hypothetical protein EON64_09750 [archaeon]|nr:MAG: hypothetical protein EON64_09750 [archaeon]
MGNSEFCRCFAYLPCFSQVDQEHSSSQHTLLRSDDSCCEKRNIIHAGVELSTTSFPNADRPLNRNDAIRDRMEHADECIICLEEFTTDNPKVKTLCNCGENRSSFHYPCLLYWLEHKASCPNCSSNIFFQEDSLEI